MTANVDAFPSLPRPANTSVGLPVSSRTGVGVAALLNQLLGRHATLIPLHNPNSSFTGGSSHTYRFWTWPRRAGTTRVWMIRLRANGVIPATITATRPSFGESTSLSVSVESDRNDGAHLMIDELGDAPVGAGEPEEIDLTITNGISGNVDLEVIGIGCFEAPRRTLATDELEHGVSPGTCRADMPILNAFDVGRHGDSFGALARGADALIDVTRRCGLFHWAVDDSQPFATSSTSFVDVFELPFVVNARHKEDGVDSRAEPLRLRARVTSGSGEVRFTSSLATVTFSLSSTSFGWHEDELLVRTEDVTHALGLKGGSWEEVDVEARITSGSGQIELSGISLGEGGPGNTAGTLTDNLSDDVSRLQQNVSSGISTSSDYAASIYVRKDADESRFPALWVFDNGTTKMEFQVEINTKTGQTATSEGSPSVNVVDEGDFWRLEVVDTTASDATEINYRIMPAASDTLGGARENAPEGSAVFFGAQLEQASSASAYEKTEGSAGTRNVLEWSEQITEAKSAWSWFGGSDGTSEVNTHRAPRL